MDGLATERRNSIRINFTDQPRLMLKAAGQGTYSASLVDLCADGLCLSTDAAFGFGTSVKAYCPDHRGPTIKARVIRSWAGGLALNVPHAKPARLRRLLSRLLTQDQTRTTIMLQPGAKAPNNPARGLWLIMLGFLTGFGLLAWQATPQTAGLASLMVLLTTLGGGGLMDQNNLALGSVRRAIALAITVFFLGILSSAPPNIELIQGGYDKLWIMVLTIFGFYFASRPLDNYLQNKKTCEQDAPES